MSDETASAPAPRAPQPSLAALHTSRRAADAALLEMLKLGDLALDAHAEGVRDER
jgi:hypothetical protein